ncbi:MAG: universal stress protein [Haloarculaceae archaeon]
MFDRILVPVDGSDCATRAARLALELADRYGAAVDVVVVAPAADERAADAAAAGREILSAVAALAEETGGGIDVETHYREGRPAAEITAFAAEHGTDLVVMGRRGRAGLDEHLLGTVTERVLRGSDVPVLTVASADRPVGAIENVLVTTDGSENAERAAPYAADLAGQFGATLHALSVVDVQAAAGVFSAGGVSAEFVERLEAEAAGATERLVAAGDGADLDVRTEVVQGTPYREIGAYVVDHGVDLVVMASEGESSLAGQHLGSVASRVLRTVTVPVLVVTD